MAYLFLLILIFILISSYLANNVRILNLQGPVYFKNILTQKCVQGTSNINVELQTVDCRFDDTTLKWNAIDLTGSGSYRISPAFTSSLISLDNKQSSYDLNNPIILYNNHDGNNQKFQFQRIKYNIFSIKCVQTGYCLTDYNNKLVSYTCGVDDVMLWEISTWYDCPQGQICPMCSNLEGFYPLINTVYPCYHSSNPPDSYYLDSYNRCFNKCYDNCKRCNDSTQCIQCNDGFFLNSSGSQYIYSSPNGFYDEPVSKSCKNCIPNCEKCINDKSCDLCQSNFYFHSTAITCTNTCPEYYFPDPKTRKCESCMNNCIYCFDGSTCNRCINDFYYYSNSPSCLDTCPDGFYPDSTYKKCESCLEMCEKCSNGISCVLCKNNHYYMPSDISCLSSCPVGYYEDSITRFCLPCNNNCELCPNGICSTCRMRFYLDQINECKPCSEYCEVCDNDTKCTQCDANFFMTDLQTCVHECPITYWGDINLRKCLKCPANCDVCINSSECELCGKDYFNMDTDDCSQTKSGYYGNDNTRKWNACIQHCDVCVNSYECEKCHYSYYFFNNDRTECITCPDKYFSDDDTQNCEACPKNCLQCENATDCLECIPSFFYFPDGSKTCETCPIGYYGEILTKNCERCVTNCDICENNSECLKCSEGFFNLSKVCVKTCPIRYYKNIRLSECSQCRDVCSKCQDDTDYCLICSNNSYSFFESTSDANMKMRCVNDCPKNYFPSINKECKLCKDLGKFSINEECVDQCGFGYFKRIETSECVLCDKPDEYKYEGKCVTSCPDKYLADPSNLCINLYCDDQCKNKGECYIEDYKIKCKCSEMYSGEFCETMLPITLDLINNEEPVTPETIDYLVQMKDDINNGNILVTPQLTKFVTDLANNQMELVKIGKMNPDPALFEVFGAALNINMIVTDTEDLSAQENIDNLKNNISDLSDLVMVNYNDNTPNTIVSDEFYIQYATTDSKNMQNMTNTALKNNISLVNATNCELALKKAYNIPEEMNLIVKKIDFSPRLNLSSIKDDTRLHSNSIIYEYFNPLSKIKMDINICNNVTVRVKVANSNVTSNLNFIYYKKLSDSGLDMLDHNSKAYHTRCIPIKDPISGKDASVGYRSKNYYQNRTAECADNCNYSGLDENRYVICDCIGLYENETIVNSMVKKNITLKLPHMNLDIALCIFEVVIYPDIFSNAGLYICGTYLITSLIFYAAYRGSGHNLIENNINKVINNDCKFFDSEEMTVKEYFEYNKIKRSQNPEYLSRLEANIDFVKNSECSRNSVNNSKRLLKNTHKRKKLNKPRKINSTSRDTFEHSKSNVSININKINSEIPKESNIKIKEKNLKRSLKWKMKLIKKHPSITEKNHINKDPSPIEDIKIYKYRPYKPNVYLRFPDHIPTLKDFECLSPYDSILYDDRSFKYILFHFLIDEHPIFGIIFRYSLIDPVWIEIVYLCFNLSILFAMNALFFTDSYIDMRAAQPSEDGFFVAYYQEFPKTFISLVATIILLKFVEFFNRIPSKVEEEFNKALKTKNKHAIKIGYQIFLTHMKPRYRMFMMVTSIFNILFWYYVIAFCGIYSASSLGWIYGSFAGLLLDWLILSIVIPLVKACLRILIRRFKKIKFLISLEYVIWIIKNFAGQ